MKNIACAMPFVICSIQFDFGLLPSRVKANTLIKSIPSKPKAKKTMYGREKAV